MQTKLSRFFFFSAFLEFPHFFLQKSFMNRTLHFIGDFNLDILLTVLDVCHLLCFIFC